MFNFRRNSTPAQPIITVDEDTNQKDSFFTTPLGVTIASIGLGVAVGAVLVYLNKGVENADVI